MKMPFSKFKLYSLLLCLIMLLVNQKVYPDLPDRAPLDVKEISIEKFEKIGIFITLETVDHQYKKIKINLSDQVNKSLGDKAKLVFSVVDSGDPLIFESIDQSVVGNSRDWMLKKHLQVRLSLVAEEGFGVLAKGGYVVVIH